MLLIKSLTPKEEEEELSEFIFNIKSCKKLNPFDPFIVKIVDEISKAFVKSKQKELVSLGYFFRKSNLEAYKKSFSSHLVRMPVGIVFHIVPSNVDFLFLYSSMLSMLVGNVNVVRLSSRTDNSLVKAAFNIMNEIFAKHNYLGFKVITYDRSNEEATKELSLACNMRLVWGNDQTIDNIRKFPIKSHTKELCFYDRFSFSIVDCCEFADLSGTKKKDLIEKYYTDLYTLEQNACSSPKLIIWLGDNLCDRFEFYNLLSKKAEEYKIQDWNIVNKDLKMNLDAADGNVKSCKRFNSKLTVATINSLEDFDRNGGNCGYLYEYLCDDYGKVFSFIEGSNKDQTITYFGIDDDFKNNVVDCSKESSLSRIVPVGEALNFSYIWDGHNLLEEFSKIIVV